MRNRKLDDNGDYSFGHSEKSFYVNEAMAVSQAVMTRLQLWENEWFLDITEGTPYLYGIMGKYTRDTLDQLIRTRILETEGVVEIIDYTSTFDGDLRKVKIDVTISTIYGEAAINGTF